MQSPDYDIVITGAGPVGSALALLLAQQSRDPARIALVGTFATGPSAQEPDPRSIAVNQGSRKLLESVSAWPQTFSRIQTVHVSQHGRLGRTLIRHDEMNVPELGYVATYPTLLNSLHQAVSRSGVSCLEGKPGQVEYGNGVRLHLDGGVITGTVGIQSDGARPKGLKRQYDQCAILATVRADEPRDGWAFERFTRQGPLALLPHPSGANHYGLVWCCRPDSANRLQRAGEPEFDDALNQQFGNRLGHLATIGPRQVFELTLHAGPSRTHTHGVAIGNAAQTLHPVAGQGLNLGLRDAAQLAQALRCWQANPQADPVAALDHFTRVRRPDRWLTAAITDMLPRVFATGSPMVEHAAGFSLLALDLSLTLRRPLARHLMQGLRT